VHLEAVLGHDTGECAAAPLRQQGEERLRLDIVWDGITRANVLDAADAGVRQELADAAKRYDWTRVLAILREHPGLVNTTRPGGDSLFAPLHQAAHAGASLKVAEELILLGAWRTLQNARGERAIDIADRRGHKHLLGIMEPRLKRRIPSGVLLKIQSRFHEVILGRAADHVRSAGLRLPEIEPLLELEMKSVWFDIPGMCGGFSYHLQTDGVEAVLVSDSWSRVVEGSGERHEVTSAASKLVAEGFV
jgi:hypothetical protein